jgi:hypothetical protein
MAKLRPHESEINSLKLNYCFPVRGSSQPIIFLFGSLTDGIRSMAFLAKDFACSGVCRLSLGRDIHSRIIFRRSSCSGFIFKSWFGAIYISINLAPDPEIPGPDQSFYGL